MRRNDSPHYCCRWTTPTPRSAPCSTSKASPAGGTGAPPATTRSKPPSTAPGSTARPERSPRLATAPEPTLDLGALGFDRGAHLLVERAMATAPPGTAVTVVGDDPHLDLHLR